MPRFRLRFGLKTLFVLILGIAIGYGLNLRTLQLLIGPPNEALMRSLPTYIIEPPDILDINATAEFSEEFPSVSGQYIVGPDGSINLGTFGRVPVGGQTIGEAQDAIKKVLAQVQVQNVSVDIFAYNSKSYYIVTEGLGIGDTVTRFPVTGNDTVLDAIALSGSILQASTRMWISRPAPNGIGGEKVLPVAWQEITKEASTATNYQLMPGDRLFVSHRSPPGASR